MDTVPDLLTEEAVFVRSAVEEWREDILLWVRDVFPDLKLRTVQEEILTLAARGRSTAFKAPRGSGKSVADALFGMWRLALFRNFVPVLSLTRGQVSDVWKEVQSLFRASELPRLFPDWSLYEDELRTSEPTVRMRTGSAESGAERLESGHGPHGVTLIIDQAAAVPDSVFQSALGMLVNGEDDRLLATCTAGLPVGFFSRAFTVDRPWWSAVRVYSAFDPALDDVPLVREQAETYARLWGTSDPKYRMDYLSEDNVTGDAGFFDHRKIEMSIEREVTFDESEPRVLALDVARLGADKTIAAVRRGDRLEQLIELPKTDLMTTTGNVVRLIRQISDPHPTLVVIDAVGLGAGVHDRLVEALRENGIAKIGRVRVVEFIGGASPDDDDDRQRYQNLKTCAAHKLRVRMERARFSMPSHAEAIAELCSYQQEIASSGKMKITDPKHKSPDFGDAILMAFAFEPGHTVSAKMARPRFLGY